MDNKYVFNTCTVLLLLFFIIGAMNHTINFSGKIGTPNNTQIWHGFYLAVSVLSLFSVIVAKELSYYWLLTVFLWHIPVEIKAAIFSYQSENTNSSQVLEPLLNIIG